MFWKDFEIKIKNLFSHIPIQQTRTDVHSAPQKLSKIETLRLARNYIVAMTQTLKEGKPMETSRFLKILCKDLSQTTANLLTSSVTGTQWNFPKQFELQNECNGDGCYGAGCVSWQDYNVTNLNMLYINREGCSHYQNFNGNECRNPGDWRCAESGYYFPGEYSNFGCNQNLYQPQWQHNVSF